eukprot:444169_1
MVSENCGVFFMDFACGESKQMGEKYSTTIIAKSIIHRKSSISSGATRLFALYIINNPSDMPMLRKMVEETKQPVRKQQSEEHCQNKECTLSEFTERLDDIAHEPNNTNQFNRNDATSRPHKRRKISKNKFVSGCDDAKDDVLDDPYRDDDYRNQIEMENDTMSEYSEDDDAQYDMPQRKRQHIASFEKSKQEQMAFAGGISSQTEDTDWQEAQDRRKRNNHNNNGTNCDDMMDSESDYGAENYAHRSRLRTRPVCKIGWTICYDYVCICCAVFVLNLFCVGNVHSYFYHLLFC